MPEITSYRPGSFCWTELATSDAASSTKFYTQLFGWTTNEIPISDGMFYVILQRDGLSVAALYETKDVPPNWLSYVNVTSVDESLAKAKELGANVVAGPMDVFDAGRMGVLTDPQGAPFGLWQAAKHIGARVAREPNTMCWNELCAKDDVARAFYSALFGWRMEQVNYGEPYTLIHNGDELAGGLFKMEDYGAEMPPNWMTYFSVADCDATAAQVKSLGGKIFLEPKDIPTVGRIALFADPQGAMFSVLQPA